MLSWLAILSRGKDFFGSKLSKLSFGLFGWKETIEHSTTNASLLTDSCNLFLLRLLVGVKCFFFLFTDYGLNDLLINWRTFCNPVPRGLPHFCLFHINEIYVKEVTRNLLQLDKSKLTKVGHSLVKWPSLSHLKQTFLPS